MILVSRRCGQASGGRCDRSSVMVYSEGAGQQPVTNGGWLVQMRQSRECDGVNEISKMIIKSREEAWDWSR
jgi:hypothetical protein